VTSQRQNHAKSWFPVKKLGKKKYVKFFAQGSCVKTKSGVAEIKRNFTNFAGWFQKKICFLSLP
tara:strand:- start:1016 stop:1207 length:192 start_codon:yes stop_codon:yes gene_type:complete